MDWEKEFEELIKTAKSCALKSSSNTETSKLYIDIAKVVVEAFEVGLIKKN